VSAILKVDVLCAGLLWWAFASGPALAQPISQQGNRKTQGIEYSFAAQLERLALDEMNATGIPGAAIGIVSEGKIVFCKGFGHGSVEEEPAVTSATLFRLGSTTKMFTAAAVVEMAQAGKIDLKRHIAEYTSGLDPEIAALNTDQLLSHTSGLRSDDPPSGSGDESMLAAEVRSWKGSRLFTRPGEIFSYSSDGYWLAGFVAESIEGKPYATVMTELFHRLGMVRSTFRPTMAITYPIAQGHRMSSGKAAVVRPMPDTPASWPAGSMFSSADDLCRWLLVLLGDGQIEGKRVLLKGTVEQLFAPHAGIPGSTIQYGYGLSIGEYRGIRVLEHGGTRAGYGSFIRIAPEQKTAIVVLTNLQSGELPKTVEKASELLLPLMTPEPPALTSMQEMTTDEMNQYVGVYKNGDARRVSSISVKGVMTFRDDSPGVEIFVRDSQLKLRQGQTEFSVSKIGVRRFAIKQPGAPREDEFVLVPDSSGKITYLVFGDFAMKRQ
jgi:CubicO group peptidase (beta-lactamase class C family)